MGTEDILFSLSPSNVAKITDGRLPCALWAYYLGYTHNLRDRALRMGKEPPSDIEVDSSLPRGVRLVRSYMRFDGNILNGGFCQYISNHTRRGDPGDVYEDLFAIRTIGASESVELLEKAINVFRRVYGWPSRQDDPCDVPPAWENPEIERLDSLRCNDESSCRDYKILDAYLKKHLGECILSVKVKCRAWRLEGAWHP